MRLPALLDPRRAGWPAALAAWMPPALAAARLAAALPGVPAPWREGLTAWLAAMGLLFLLLGLGRHLLRLPLLRDLPPLEAEGRLLLQLLAGLQAASALLLALALGGLLAGPAGGAAAVLLGAAGLAGLPATAREWLAARNREPAPWQLPAILLFGLLWLLPLALQTFLPDLDWDSAAYHRPLARSFLAAGPWAVDPVLAPQNFPGGVHLLYALLIALGSPGALVPLNLLAVLLHAPAAHALGRRVGGRPAGLLAAALVLSNNVLPELGLDARVDPFLSLYFLVAVYLFLAWRAEPRRAGPLLALGLALGLGAGAKHAGLGLALLPGLPALGLALCGRPAPPRRALALSLLLLALPQGFWYARNWIRLGDPVYPFAGGLRYPARGGGLAPVAPALARLRTRLPAPPPGWFAVEPEETGARRALDPVDLVLDPGRYAVEKYQWLNPLALAGLLLPLLVRTPAALWLHLLALAALAGLGSIYGLLRYLLPALGPLSAAAGAFLAALPGRRWGPLLPLLPALVLAGNGLAEWEKLGRLEPLPRLAGREDLLTYTLRHGYDTATPAPLLARHLLEGLGTGRYGPATKVLLVGEEKGELLPCDHVPDTSFLALRWLVELLRHDGDLAAIHRSLRARGITHLAVNLGYFRWVMATLPARLPPLLDHEALRFSLFHLERFTRSHGRLLYAQRGLSLYALR